MRLDRLITLGLVHPFRGLRPHHATAPRQLPVLMYHSISEDPEPAFSPYYKVCTSPQRFAEHMQWLAEAGFRGVTLTEGLAWLRASGADDEAITAPGRPVAITFDDGFRDFATTAFPAMQKHGFAATMYLPTAFIGNERQTFKSRECLTWNEVRELADAGMEFGSHTVNHPVLVRLPWAEIEQELRVSKATIEDRLQRRTPSFAYPFAYPQERRDYTTRLTELFRTIGYTNACTTIIGRQQPKDSAFAVKRLPANSCDDRQLLLAKMSGCYDWLRVPQSGIRHASALLKADPRPLSSIPAN